MKIKAIFDKHDKLIGWMEVIDENLEFDTENEEQVYEVEVDDDLVTKQDSEEIERAIRQART
jgi:hypothetical protein